MTDREMLEIVGDTLDSTYEAMLNSGLARAEVLGILNHLIGKINTHLSAEDLEALDAERYRKVCGR